MQCGVMYLRWCDVCSIVCAARKGDVMYVVWCVQHGVMYAVFVQQGKKVE